MTLTAVLGAVLLLAPATCDANAVALRVRVRALDHGQFGPKGTLTLRATPPGTTDDQSKDFLDNQPLSYAAPLSTIDNPTNVQLVAQPSSDAWHPRTVGLWEFQRPEIPIHLVPVDLQFAASEIEDAKNDLQDYLKPPRGPHRPISSLDKALAFFAVATGTYPPPTPPSAPEADTIKVWYNYASALVNACKEGYATCDEARAECERTRGMIAASPNPDALRLRLGIGHGAFETCAAIPAQIETRLRYRRLRKTFRTADGEHGDAAAAKYLEAAELAEKALELYAVDSRPWLDNSVNRRRLVIDAGTAYLKYADAVSAAFPGAAHLPACDARGRSHALLSSIPAADLDPTSRRNVEILLPAKLHACGRSVPAPTRRS